MTLSYCEETVRKHDPDRFLLGMFMPASVRPSLWAIYAFNYEIAKTREVVTETQLGLIRLQWWRDAIGAIYQGKGAPEGQPVLQALAAAIRAHDLRQEDFDNLIYAREFDLEDRAPSNDEGVLKYAELTTAPLIRLSLAVLGRQGILDEEIASTATAYGLTGLLRAVPFHLSQHRIYLPENRIGEREDLFEGKNLEKLRPVAKDLAKAALDILSGHPPSDKFLKLHAELSRIYLEQIRAAGYDLFSPKLRLRPLLRGLLLGWRCGFF